MITRRPFVNILVSITLVLAGVGAQAQCFTTSAPTNNCTYGDQINAFTLNSISAIGNSGCGSGGYNSFSSPVWNLNIGQSYSWSSTVGSGMYPQGFAIWIDLNNNGIYESSEMLATSGYNYSHSGNITIPTGSTAGSNIRMRIRCAYYSSISGTDVCTNGIGYGYGETEDYYVNLLSPCTAPTTPTLAATNSTICNPGGSSILSIATGTLNSATTWSWYSGSCGGTAAGTGTSITVSPTTTTTYYARGTGGCVTPGACGSVTVTVNQAPTISVQPPASVTQCSGSTLNLGVTSANGTGYQWYKGASPLSNGGNISGATSANLQITGTTPAESGVYSVVITAATSCTNLTSANSNVTINPAVTISSQPAPLTNACNGSVVMLSVASSNGLSYQWYKGVTPLTNGGNISGATTANLQISPIALVDAGTYSLVIGASTGCSPLTSNNAVVNVNPRPTATTTVAGSAIVCDGTPTNISIVLTGTGPWTFNYFDGTTNTPVTTSTNPYIVAVSPSATTTYSITSLSDANCVANGPDYATTATVNVNPRPTATLSNNGPSTICDGSSTGVDITFTGATPWSFTYSDGTTPTPVAAYGPSVYNLTVNPNTTTTYSVTALADNNGCIAQAGDISSTATVTVNYAPSIVTPPTATTACSGVGTSLVVLANGTTLTYQWRLNGNPLSDNAIYSGTGTNTLTISNVTGLGGGMYDVVISGVCPPIITTTAVMLTENLNNTWDGSTSTAWSDATNWSCSSVPIVTTNVLIPAGTPNMPLVDIPTAICNTITIDPLATVAFAGTNNALEIKSTITNNGVFDASLGKVILSGTGAQNVPPITYKNLDISGGSTKTLDGPATVTGILALINGYLQIGPYDLTIDVPVQILGGNATSFIVTNDTGEVIGKNMGLIGGNPDAAMFPVGVNPGSYTPIMLENMGNADDYRVRVMPNVYEDGYGVNPQMVVNPVVNRTWMVSEGTSGGSYVNMNPYWNSVNEINGFTQTHVYVAHYIGGMWISYEDSANGAAAAGTFGSLFYADVDSLQNFSPFTVASSINTFPFPLAIKLLDISAMNAGKRNRLIWNTATEAMGDKFEIQRSIDGKTFTAIGNMNANGKPSSYSYWDETPFTGKNFYRLKLTDVNGKSGYSNVVSATVKGLATTFGVNVYPNPIEGGKITVIVNGNISGEASVVITDVTGAVVKQIRSLSSNSLDIDVSELAQGVYFVKYSDDVHHEIIKVNKQ